MTAQETHKFFLTLNKNFQEIAGNVRKMTSENYYRCTGRLRLKKFLSSETTKLWWGGEVMIEKEGSFTFDGGYWDLKKNAGIHETNYCRPKQSLGRTYKVL